MRVVFLHFLLSITMVGQSQQGKTFDSLVMKSSILNKDKKFAIYLPAGYNTSKLSYPVLYLLHGGSGNQKDWIAAGNMKATTDKAIAEGKAAPMIVVMPDAEMTFYMNNVKGEYQFEDYFFKELIPYIEKEYRCRKEKKFRAISGLSMGGFGSLLYSFHHPEMFSSCAALSAAVRTDEQINAFPLDQYLARFKTAMGDVKEGEQRITPFWNQNSILYLVQRMPEEQKKSVRFYLDCGDDDFLYKGNSFLHIAMRDVNIPHEYRVRNGGHTWDYWKSALPDVLAFVSAEFR